jgi:hypothetical protein
METLTIKINTRKRKGRDLVKLIDELAKDGSVEIQKNKVYRDVEEALRQVKEGNVKPISELFNPDEP